MVEKSHPNYTEHISIAELSHALSTRMVNPLQNENGITNPIFSSDLYAEAEISNRQIMHRIRDSVHKDIPQNDLITTSQHFEDILFSLYKKKSLTPEEGTIAVEIGLLNSTLLEMQWRRRFDGALSETIKEAVRSSREGY
jgi:hypothetical protein